MRGSRKMKKIWSLILAAAMVFALSMPALAAEADPAPGAQEIAEAAETMEPAAPGAEIETEAPVEEPADEPVIIEEPAEEEPEDEPVVLEEPEADIPAEEEIMETADDPDADPYDKANFTVEVTAVDVEAGTFTVKLTGPVPEDATKIEFPTWCSTDQSDIYWYKSATQIDKNTGLPKDTYSKKVNLSHHKYTFGKYKTHVYITDGDGVRHKVGGVTQMMEMTKGNLVVSSDPKETKIPLFVQNMVVPGGAADVQFAVWSKNNGQDDLKWYSYSSRTKAGSYKGFAVISNHKEAGVYNVHAYAKLKDGSKVFIGSGTFTISGISGSLTTNAVNGKKGTFGAIGYNFNVPAGVKQVRFAVWSTTGQTDLHWYTATKQSGGSYTQVVNVANHKYNFGTYKVHMYVTANNGISKCVATKTVKIEPNNYVYAKKADDTGTVYDVTIVNPNINGNPVSEVKMPTWSQTNSQDDTVWYKATKNADGSFTARVDSVNHKHGGKYNTHVYGDGKKIGDTTYSMNFDEVRAYMIRKAQGFSSLKSTLIMIDLTHNRLGVFQGSQGNWKLIRYWLCTTGSAADPSPVGTYKLGAKGPYFITDAQTKCYHYATITGTYLIHSICYWPDGRIKDDRLGYNLSHGCIRVATDNAKWIQDNVRGDSTVHLYK